MKNEESKLVKDALAASRDMALEISDPTPGSKEANDYAHLALAVQHLKFAYPGSDYLDQFPPTPVGCLQSSDLKKAQRQVSVSIGFEK